MNHKNLTPTPEEKEAESLCGTIRHLEWQLGLTRGDGDEEDSMFRPVHVQPDPLTPEQRAHLQAQLAAALAEYKPILRAIERARTRRWMAKVGWEVRVLDTIGAPDFKPAGPYHEALRSLNERDGGLIVLSGNVGSGKTTAAAAWASEWPGGSERPRFLRAAEFFRSSRYGDRRDEILGCNALVLDDLGAEYADKGGSYAVDFDELCDAFYGDKRTLVVTTNIAWGTPTQRAEAKGKGIKVDETQPTFVERYGDRVLDRVRHCGKWVSSSAPSMRKRQD